MKQPRWVCDGNWMRPSAVAVALVSMTLANTNAAIAASFDCAAAQTDVELLVCADPSLSLLDEVLARIYQELLTALDGSRVLTQEQGIWLRTVRNRCSDAGCLSAAYQERVAELSETPLSNDPTTCTGDVKRAIDAGAELDTQIPVSDRATKWGHTNDGTLMMGAYWLPYDVATLYSSIRCWSSAIETAKRIDPADLRERALVSVSAQYARAGYVELALAIQSRLSEDESSVDAAYRIADALVEKGRVDEARVVLERVTTRRNFMANPTNVLLSAMIRHQQLDDADALAEQIGANWNEYYLLALAYLDRGDTKRAVARIETARRLGGGRGVVALESAIFYSRAGQFRDAFDAANAADEPLSRIYALITVAKAATDAGETGLPDEVIESARVIAGELNDGEGRGGTACHWLSEGLGKTGRLEAARLTIATCQTDRVARAAALRGLADHGDVEGARSLREDMDEYGASDGDGPIAVALARRGDFAESLTVVSTVRNDAIWQDAIRRIAAMNPEGAVIREWLDAIPTQRNKDMTAAAVQTLTAAAARTGNTDLAEAWLASVTQRQVKARGYLGIAQGLLGIVPGKGSLTGD
jgi:uncharacterized protein